MNTSGTGTVFTIGYWVVLATTLACAGLLLGDLRLRLRAPRPAALTLVAVVAVPSLIFNLVVLFVIATLAVYAWGPVRAIGLFLVGVIGFNLTATFAFASPGGGNSAATIFLATTLVGLALVRLPAVQALAAAVVVAAAGAVLIAVNDAHGIPILAGLVIGAGLALASPARDMGRPGGTRPGADYAMQPFSFCGRVARPR
jgi:hypothetical protein